MPRASFAPPVPPGEHHDTAVAHRAGPVSWIPARTLLRTLIEISSGIAARRFAPSRARPQSTARSPSILLDKRGRLLPCPLGGRRTTSTSSSRVVVEVGQQRGADPCGRPTTTRTPSGAISWACCAAEPCQTPSVRVALPLIAAARGAVASISNCQWGSSASLEVGHGLRLRAERHAQDHDLDDRARRRRVLQTAELGRPARATRSSRRPPAGHARCRAIRSRPGPRHAHSLTASPKPSAPSSDIVSDVSLAGKRSQYRSRPIPARRQITCGQWPGRTIDDLS